MLKVLLIDNKEDEIEHLETNLNYEGFEVIVKNDAETGLSSFKNGEFSGIIIDLDTVGENAGFEFIKNVRKQNREISLIVLSSSKSVQDKIYVLNIGADDYVEKPFHEDELTARLKAHIRKVNFIKENPSLATIVYSDSLQSHGTIGKAKIYFDKMLIKIDNEEIYLTSKETSILNLLYKNRGKVVSRERMIKEIWGGKDFVTERVIDTNIVSIRKKLKDTGKKPKYIKSVFGIGYKLIEEE